jgi:predicted Zn-dependent protease
MGVARLSLRLLALLAAMLLLPMTASAQSSIRDAEIEGILREYFDPLLTAAGLQPRDVDIILINDPSLNAFVAGGQKIHIHTGLILATDSPEQLKGVIAHEIGHIVNAHLAMSEEAMKDAQGISMISIGLGVLAIAAGAPDAGVALMSNSGYFAALNFFTYGRVAESQADQTGVTLMEQTGQSAEGMVYFFEKFRYEELMSSRRQDPYFRMHPISTQRIAAIRARVAQAETTAQPQSERAIQQLAIMKAKLIGFLQSPMQVARKYPHTDLSENALYARSISEYRAVDIGAALRDIDALLERQPDNPYYWELKGQILFENGRIAESIEPHRKSVQLAPNQPLLKVNLARSLIESRDMEKVREAEGVLMDALAQERDNAFAWNQLAACYGKLNRTPEAALATAEERYYIGDIRRAHVFAQRAAQGLDRTSSNWQRADDIIRVTDPRLPGNRQPS